MFLKKIGTFLLIGAVLWVSCSKDSSNSNSSSDGGSDNFTLSGKLGGSYLSSAARGDRAAASYTLWATPLYGGDVNQVMAPGRDTRFITADTDISMNFTIQYDQSISDDWLVLLIDPSLDKSESVIGYVTMGVSDEENTLRLPTGYSDLSELDLGTLAPNPDDSEQALSDNSPTDNAAAFTLSAETLVAMAKTSDLLKAYKNLYVNYDSSADTYYHPMLIFDWQAGKITDIVATAQSASTIANSERLYHFNIKTNALPYAMPADGTDIPANIQLYPPAGKTATFRAWEPLSETDLFTFGVAPNPLYADSSQITSGDMITDTDAPGMSTNEYVMGFTYFDGAPPAGTWSLSNGTDTFCYFDVSNALPVDDLDNPMIYIPVPTLTVDAENVITGISLVWYLYDADSAGKYRELSATELADLPKIIAGELPYRDWR